MAQKLITILVSLILIPMVSYPKNPIRNKHGQVIGYQTIKKDRKGTQKVTNTYKDKTKETYTISSKGKITNYRKSNPKTKTK